MSRVGRLVEKVLRQRRIRRARIGPESDAELRTAILLRSARLGAGSVREEFVTSLHQRLNTELAADPAPPAPVTTRRRRFVQLTATAAAALGIGAGLDHVLTGAATAAPPGESTLTPDHAVWHTVADSHELAEGGVLRFDIGTVTGFIRRTNGTVAAVSGICTHLGCRLNLDARAKQLDCPCHGASFSLTGTVIQHRLPVPLAPLPDITVRESGGVVQILAPRA